VPIYEYICSACGHRTDILHGVHDAGPHFCAECGAEGAMRKAVVAPAVHFKGSGWAKKERRSGTAPKTDPANDDGSPATTPTSADKGSGSGPATSSAGGSGSAPTTSSADKAPD